MPQQTVTDQLFQITQKCVEPSAQILWIADENTAEHITQFLSFSERLTLLTNRYDLWQQCSDLNINCFFGDFDFSILDKNFDIAVYSISKERPVCHHIFNHISALLPPEGKFIVGGKKSEGVKGYFDKLTKQLGFTGKLNKDKDIYTAQLEKHTATSKTLNTKNYAQLRTEITLNQFEVASKPGLYGWNKIDKGSELLINTTSQYLSTANLPQSRSMLDLGCGYGFLTLSALLANEIFSLDQIVATDNNAAAIDAATKNINTLIKTLNPPIECKIIAGDCGDSIQETFDLVLCNPPFHQGFSTSKDLTEKFVESAAKHTKQTGLAFFVTNAFIGIEKYAKHHFKSYEMLENDGQFKVICMHK